MTSLLGRKPVGTIVLNAATSNISTGAWTQAIAAVLKAASNVEIFNSTGATLYVSQGTAGNETNSDKLLPYTILQGGSSMMLPIEIKAGLPITVKSLDNAATTGILVLNLFG
jgi:hypothetical protein